ncbi:hypothetical protein [Methylobacterium durans]|uniref:Uncharacterized protein n=1 Tax=Methylobacterium durans TaxID=2202825 RepID=A0A2U8W840_9HYPH|nr:hypothetical protein [Methylobacterium durans]AWN41670.1 hypothetical protein DK389_15590 [Methylobacterium durans]
MRAAERQRQEVLYRQTGFATAAMRWDGVSIIPMQFEELFGRPLDVLMAAPFDTVPADRRQQVIDGVAQAFATESPYMDVELRLLAGSVKTRCLCVSVPVYDVAGRLSEQAGFLQPLSGRPPTISGSLRQGLEQCIEGHRIRAARGLLDWSMMTLAAARGLSFSTIRCLEENGETRASPLPPRRGRRPAGGRRPLPDDRQRHDPPGATLRPARGALPRPHRRGRGPPPKSGRR